MTSGSTVLVTGGAGYIGSHPVRALRAAGRDVVVLDSLELGDAEAVIDAPLLVGNITDRDLVIDRRLRLSWFPMPACRPNPRLHPLEKILMPFPIQRRNLMCGTLAAAAVSATPRFNTLAVEDSDAAPKPLGHGSVVLFQGDSITDAGRDRGQGGANNPRGLGRGYAMLIAAGLLRDHAAAEIKVFNRGISGNKVPDLAARWQAECYDLKPSVLSNLIGVNDIWHKLHGRYDGTVADYQSGFEALLKETRERLPETRIVVCEPFVLRCGAVNDSWFPEFDHRRAECADVAQSMSLDFVPFQAMFDSASERSAAREWASDGVHPTLG